MNQLGIFLLNSHMPILNRRSKITQQWKDYKYDIFTPSKYKIIMFKGVQCLHREGTTNDLQARFPLQLRAHDRTVVKLTIPELLFMERIAQIYAEVSKEFQKEEFHWADLGSFGSADAYLLPLTSLNGRCLCVEGRDDSKDASEAYKVNPFIRSSIETVNTFISGKKERRFFYETPEGGGSSFYPSQDLISQSLEGIENRSLKRHIVQCTIR